MIVSASDLIAIGRTAVKAIAGDDVLYERLVLKGGNAIQLVHQLGSRASGDLDFSMEGKVALAELGERLEKALRVAFATEGIQLFDFDLAPRPSNAPEESKWGGYACSYKLIRVAEAKRLRAKAAARAKTKESAPPEAAELHRMLQQAGRTFEIDISHHEYVEGSTTGNLDGQRCRVYTPVMIVAEKLRAICQQMPEYVQRKHPAPRARDFYDIHALVTLKSKVRIEENVELCSAVFEAKDVPRLLIGKIGEHREFHRADWGRVRQAVTGEVLQEFDHYFDFVVAEAAKLKAAWDV